MKVGESGGCGKRRILSLTLKRKGAQFIREEGRKREVLGEVDLEVTIAGHTERQTFVVTRGRNSKEICGNNL